MDQAFSLRQTRDFARIRTLNEEIFPGEPYRLKDSGTYWIMSSGRKVVGFCGIHELDSEPGAAFLSRAGLLREAQGRGLHKRMIRARLRYAKRRGFNRVITYTMETNLKSANNLIACGFRLYVPEYRYAGAALYFIIDL